MGRPEKAVYFKREDYADPGIRLAILAIDGLLLLGVLFFLSIIGLFIEPSSGYHKLAPGLCWPLFCVLYLGPLHATGLKTIGYALVGYELVSYSGGKPSFRCALVRISVPFVFPCTTIIDMTCSISPFTRQTLWDRLGETAVVRKGARPAGEATLVTDLEFVLGTTFVSREANIKGQQT